MKNLAIVAIGCCLGMACAGSTGNDEPTPPTTPGPVAGPGAGQPGTTDPEGGMDGAGSIGVGLSWNKGLFMQDLWIDGALAYVVSNERDEDVELNVFGQVCAEPSANMLVESCSNTGLLASWALPARSLRRLPGAELGALVGSERFAFVANGEPLGLMMPPTAPREGSASLVVGTSGINQPTNRLGPHTEVETDFLVPPSRTFSLRLAFAQPGELTFFTKNPNVESVSFVDIVSVGSDDADVQVTADGYEVSIPATASEASVVRVLVDVQAPADSPGRFIGFDAKFCATFDAERGECATGWGISRLIPLMEPTP